MDFWATDSAVDPYFDPRLEVWILSRYRDVAAALREPLLVPALARSTTPAIRSDTAAHNEFRMQAFRALAPAGFQRWEERFAAAAASLAGVLPVGEPVDVIERYARPWSLQVAGIATDVAPGERERLATLARSIFDSACEPYDDKLAVPSQKATVELAVHFRGSPPWSVQMFAALAHSLPALLGNLWWALLDKPAGLDELMRIAGPAKAQIRQAVEPVKIGEVTIAQDQHAILRLDVANADAGPADGHLTFGSGAHSCVGAALVKSCAAIATSALFDRFEIGERTAVPVDRFAMRYLRSLTVTLSRRQAPPQGT